MKEKIIEKFKEACQGHYNDKMREMFIGYSTNRNDWQVYCHGFGAIRVQQNKDNYKLIFWPEIGFSRLNGLSGKQDFDLTIGQHAELVKIYFGDFVPDWGYLKTHLK